MSIKLTGYFSNSFIGKCVLLLYFWYHQSRCKKIITHWQEWNRQSWCYKKWHSYIEKRPRYLQSFLFQWSQNWNKKISPFLDKFHYIGTQSWIVSWFIKGKKIWEQTAWNVKRWFVFGSLFFAIGTIWKGALWVFLLLVLLVLGILILYDYEKTTLLLALFVFIDFTMRRFGGILGSIWDELLLLGCIILWGYKMVINRKESWYKWTPLDIPLFSFIALAITHVSLNALDLHVGIEGLRAMVQYMLWYFLVIQLLRTKKGAKQLFVTLVLVGTLLGLHGVYQYITGAEMLGNWVDSVETIRTRAYSIVYSPNVLGSVMTLFIPMALSLFFAENKLMKKFLYLGSTAIMSLCLLVTFSRGAWLGFAIGIILFALMKDKRFLFPIFIGGFLIYLLVPSISNRMIYMFSSSYWARSAEGGRLYRWLEGWETLQAHNIWWGLGLGRYGGAVAINNKLSPFYMDNYYMKTLVEMGAIGLGLLLLLLYQVFIWGYRTTQLIPDNHDKTLVQGALAGVTGVIIHNFGENIFEVPTMVTYFWIVVAFIMFMRNQYEKRYDDIENKRMN